MALLIISLALALFLADCSMTRFHMAETELFVDRESHKFYGKLCAVATGIMLGVAADNVFQVFVAPAIAEVLHH